MLRTELIRPLSELLAGHARRRGAKVAFQDRHRKVTYGELAHRTGRLAGHLAALGLQPADRALIFLGNSVEVVETYLAIARARGVGVPLNPHSADAELEHVVADSGARVIVTDTARLDQVRALLPGRDYLRVVVVGDGADGDAVVSYAALMAVAPPAPPRDDQELDDVAWMLYTSGTTGKPKGVLATQRSCLWSVAACYAPIIGLSAEDHVLWPLPLHHSLAHVFCVLGVTAVGAGARIMDGFDADEVVRELSEGTYTFLAGVPALHHYLVEAARRHGVRPGRLRAAMTGGAVCPPGLRHSFEETFGVPLLDCYGSTETCGSFVVNWPTGTRVDGSCGLPVPGVTVRLVDPQSGADVAAGAEGEVWVRGPNLMIGYHGQPEATAEVLHDGWYRTGDLARTDKSGYLSVTGRIKELIIRNGENVHPGEIEDVLRQVPGVADAAVVGRPHDVFGEVPIAFVVRGPDGLDPDQLFATCREQLAAFKVPEELYEIDRVPRTPSGKITRHVLLGLPARLRAASGGEYDSLLHTGWFPLPSVRAAAGPPPRDWLLVGPAAAAFAPGLTAAGGSVTTWSGPDGPLDGPAPDTVLVGCPESGDGPMADRVATAVGELSAVLDALVRDDRLAGCRLVVVTGNALTAGDESVPDPATLVAAAQWGLLRSMQAAHPDRFVLVDLDTHEDSPGVLPDVLAADEPQVAVRAGIALRPRLTRVPTHVEGAVPSGFDPRGTVLVSGATGPMGRALARHLVAAHGARRMLLVGARGERDEPAATLAALAAELTRLGARTVVATCDVTDRAALGELLAGLKRPVTAVVYGDSEPTGSEPGLPAVVAGTTHLHELTADTPLTAFLLLGSAPDTIGAAGRTEPAAVASFLEAFAHYRRAQGRPALSVALDATGGGPTAPENLAMVDVATGTGLTHAVVMRATGAGWPGRAPDGPVPAVLRGLIDAAPAPAGDPSALGRRLAGLTGGARDSLLLDLVRAEAAGVSGLSAVVRAEPARTFRELGVTSAGAVALRNRLAAATGLTLPTTLVFDHPTPAALAAHLRAELLGERRDLADPGLAPVFVDEPVAIVGMACRYPGGVSSPDDLWRLVADGGEALVPFPADRGWDLAALAGDGPGSSITGQGGFLAGAADFDAAFFGIAPREAVAMDPQQRLVLETSWEAVELAGIDPGSLRGSRTAVFAGVMHHDYGSGAAGQPAGSEAYWGIGTAGSVVSGRVAYALGLEGPAVTVDTACSSSLVAVHLAGGSLRRGECDLALAGGVAVMATPQTFQEFTRQGGLSPDGRCRSFADDADGTGWSEGVGVLVLERLSDAVRNGHRVLATVAGSAVNSDGASNGLTAPNGLSQQRVIRQALASAGLRPSEVDAVEAHGTGTTLGDPIEAQALLAAYGQDRDRPLWLGSVKSNLGHTQAAAGIAGVIKMVQAMRHGVLPRTLHAGTPTSHVDWTAGSVRLLTEPVEWPDGPRPRRAGVSSFGISGTNAHVILEQAPPISPPVEDARVEPAVVPLPVSAKSVAALDDQIARLQALLPAVRPVDAGLSLVTSRSLFEHRAVLLSTAAGVTEVTRGVAAQPSVAVVLAGQGSQRLGMGRALAGRFPVFAGALDDVLVHLDPGVRDVMWGTDADALNQTGWTQPALFAYEVALFRLMESFGVRPDLLMGHSIGEVVAAHVAGILSLPDACTLVSARARLMQALPGGGAMVAVEAAEDEVTPLLTGATSVAAVNGPQSVVVAGDAAAVTAVTAELAGRGRKTRRLPVSHAFHSPLMDTMLTDFRTVLSGLTFTAPSVPVVSNLTGTPDADLCTPDYWVRQVRGTVRFADGVRHLAGLGVSTFLELGADGSLGAAVAVSAPDAAVIPVSRRAGDEEADLVTALARLHTGGVPVDWRPGFTGTGARQIDLPPYAFQRRRFWPEPAAPAGPDAPDSAFWQLVGGADVTAAAAQLDLDVDTAATVLPALSAWRERQQNRSLLDSWRYAESWTRIPAAPAAPTGPAAGPWLAVVPPGPTDDWTAAVLAGLGPDVVTVPGDGDRATLAARFAGQAPPALAGVVSLVAAREAAGSAEAVTAGFRSTVLTVQALGDAGITAPLWCVTCAAVSTGGSDPVTRPAQAALWGLGRAAALELPRRWGGLIDLPEMVGEGVTTNLTAVLAGTEDQVAIRDDGVFGRRLVHAPSGGGPVRHRRLRGTVLITGGTGGVGGHVARWAATQGAEHLVLIGRRGPAAPGAAELSEELTAGGARVTVVACDVADRAAVAAVLADIPAELPLSAVVHAAGVGVGDAPVESVTEAQLEHLMRAKVTAAWHLHDLTRGLDLDAFVLFSSGAGSWGSGGRPGYSAGSAFLDGLAQYRRGLGLTATAIAWGSWEGAGMGADDPETLARFRRLGVLPMAPVFATTALGLVLDEDRTTLTVTHTDWARFAPSFTAGRPSPLLSELPEVRALEPGPDTGAESEDGGELRRRLADLTAGDRERLLHDLVRAEAAAVLGYDRPDQISVDHVFRDQGFDSVTAVEMRERLRAVTGLSVPPGLVFDYPTPRAVAGYLLTRLATGAAVPTGSVADELARLEAALTGSAVGADHHADVEQRLETLLSRLRRPALAAAGGSSEDEIKSVPVDELLNIIDAELFDRS